MVSRTRAGTVISPSPGSSMTMVPMRAKHQHEGRGERRQEGDVDLHRRYLRLRRSHAQLTRR